MPTLPPKMVQVLAPFAPLFSKRIWQNAQLLLVGAILAPGRRTVSSALRAMGLDQYKQFHRYHRVLSRARWSSLQASRILLGLLLEAFVGGGPLILGIDETLERRYGRKIAARGVYRDPLRSTHEQFVKSTGLRWVCVMLLVEIPWASRVWALPFLSALAPSERYAAKRGRRHKKITEWAWQLLLVVRRWYPQREIVAIADRAYASLKLLDQCRKLSNPIAFITRLRLDGALYEPAPPRRPGQIGRPRLKGERLPNLSEVAQDPATVWKPTMIANWYGSGERMVEIASQTAVWYSTGLFAVPVRWVLIRDPEGEFKTQALLCTDLDADPEQIVRWFVMRWQLEVTFQEMRRHLGFETQRQCSDMAIQRTTPLLLGLFSLVTMLVGALLIACPGVVVAQSSTPNAGYENPNTVTTPPDATQSASESASNVSATTIGVPNGGFETGDFQHWNGANQISGSGDWFVYSGTESPLSGFRIAAPPQGDLAATTDQTNPGTHVLYRNIKLAPGMKHELSFYLYYRNRAGEFFPRNTLDFRVEPNQQYLVDILRPKADPFTFNPDVIRARLFRTGVGDPNSLAPTLMTFNLTRFAGKTVRLRFAEVDNQGFFQASVDRVRVTSEPK